MGIRFKTLLKSVLKNMILIYDFVRALNIVSNGYDS